MQKKTGACTMHGVGLIEVLVALVIVSVGILAIVGMQMTGKEANNEAVQRTTASHLALELIERMRANPTALANYVTGNVLGTGDPLALAVPNPACTSAGTACTPAQMVTRDLFEFQQAMHGVAERTAANVPSGGLVAPRACILGSGAGGTGMYELVLTWRGTQEQAAPTLGVGVCGGNMDGTNLYGSAADPTDDRHRRLMRITFYVVV